MINLSFELHINFTLKLGISPTSDQTICIVLLWLTPIVLRLRLRDTPGILRLRLGRPPDVLRLWLPPIVGRRLLPTTLVRRIWRWLNRRGIWLWVAWLSLTDNVPECNKNFLLINLVVGVLVDIFYWLFSLSVSHCYLIAQPPENFIEEWAKLFAVESSWRVSIKLGEEFLDYTS